MSELFGATRSVVKNRCALITPAGFVPGNLPGWENATSVVLISPALGARFCQFLITLNKDGQGRGNTGAAEYFAYVVEGSASVTLDAKRHRLDPGSFVYIPPGRDMHFQGSDARLLVFQKIYQPLGEADPPKVIVGHQREVKGNPYLGNDDLRLQSLLPDAPAFDMAVNIFTFQPGAALPSVETPLTEHGVLMLNGQGIYRLEADYHPVQAGDALWLAPFCPQWFVAIGKIPASYICFADVNRDPM